MYRYPQSDWPSVYLANERILTWEDVGRAQAIHDDLLSRHRNEGMDDTGIN